MLFSFVRILFIYILYYTMNFAVHQSLEFSSSGMTQVTKQFFHRFSTFALLFLTSILCLHSSLWVKYFISIFQDMLNLINISKILRTWLSIKRFIFSAKPRGIAIPNDLEVEVQSLVTKSKLVLRSSRHWLSHRQRKDSVMLMSMSKDYRNIIEGLQVIIPFSFVFLLFDNFLSLLWALCNNMI